MPGKKESSASNPNKNILAYVNELELFLDPLFTPRVNKDGSLAMGLTATQLLYLIRWADEKLPYQPRRIMHSLDYDREPQMAEYSRLIKKLKAANPVLRPQTPATKYESDRRTQRNPRSKPSCMRYVPDAPHTGEVTDKQSEPKFGGRKVKKQKNNDAKKGRGREDVDKEDSESECETQEYMRENARVIGWKCCRCKAHWNVNPVKDENLSLECQGNRCIHVHCASCEWAYTDRRDQLQGVPMLFHLQVELEDRVD